MVKFVIRTGDFKKFLDKASCKGTLQFQAKGKTDANLFSAFFIKVDKDKQELSILTIDTYYSQIKQHTTIKAKVIDEGLVEITEKGVFDTIFSNMEANHPINVSSDGKSIIIENDAGDWYKRRIVGNKLLNEVSDAETELMGWKNAHEIIDADGVKVWQITIGAASAVYPMRIKTTKKNLKKFVADSLKLTKDNDTVIICKDKNIEIWTGKPNSTNQTRHELVFEDIGQKCFDFSCKFSALQAIVPNLLDDVILNFRKTGQDTIIMRIESSDKNMKQLISLGSQDKDGIIWDTEEEEKIEEETK